MIRRKLGWLGIVRLGLVQSSLGAVVVLTTSTLNRVMVVELALPAMLPGVLVALHYAVQIVRPRVGYGSDVSARRTPWIVGGMAVLCAGGVLAAIATAMMETQRVYGMSLAVLAFMLIGFGVSAAGTSLLVLLAKCVDERRRTAAATTVWLMMIAGFAVTATIAGDLLDPYSPARLIAVTSLVSACAFALAVVAVWGVEGDAQHTAAGASVQSGAKSSFREALAQVWDEPRARHFTIFVFVSMLAYSAQDLILEPFAGAVLGFTPGESTKLSGVQHAGVLLGMIAVAMAGSAFWGKPIGSLRAWTTGGCIASAVALAGLVAAGLTGPGWPIRANVFLLGVANGAFAIAAIASMMALAGEGRESREGTRMGLWGAAQAIAFGIGGFIGTAASDLARYLVASQGTAYALVFAAEAMLFLASAKLALNVSTVRGAPERRQPLLAGRQLAVGPDER